MAALSVSYLFWISLLGYGLAALLALILVRKPILGNILAQSANMLGAAAGLAAALIHLLSRQPAAVLADLQTATPFLSLTITLDSLSAFFLLGLSALMLCVAIYSLSYMVHYCDRHNVGVFNALLAVFVAAMALVLTSGNTVLFLIAWEAMSILSYFLVVFESEQAENLRAGPLYLIMTTIGTAFLLIAFLLLFQYTGSFSLSGDFAAIPAAGRNVLFLLLLVGFSIKAGAVPLHIWLPQAHPAAPSNVSALMSGVMLKTAIYGLLRFGLVVLGAREAWWGLLLLAIGVVSALIGVLFAYIEGNIKRLLAFSSIENIGIILIGLGTGFLAIAQGQRAIGAAAIAAALFHALNHTLFKGSLFLGAGSLLHATHTKNLEEMGGLIKRLPMTAFFVLGGSLAIAAMPPFNGFASEWLTLQAIFRSIQADTPGFSLILMLTVAALALAGALAAACFLKLFSIAFLGRPRSAKAAAAREVPVSMWLGSGIPVVLCLVLGLFPGLFLRLADPVAASLTGQSLAGLMQGWFSLSADLGGTAGGTAGAAVPAGYAPALILLALAIIIGLGLVIVRLIGGRYVERRYGTWDCGFEALNARMQYSAMGFAKPIRIIFRFLFRPTRELKAGGSLSYHPESLEYTVRTESLIEKYLYEPLPVFVRKVSLKAQATIQTGSIRRYLAFILLALLAVMLYNMLY